MPLHDEPIADQATLLENATPDLKRLGCLIADADAGQVSALHRVTPSLEQLGKALAKDRAGQGEVLRKFEADESLEKLERLSETQRSEFDALDFIGRLRLEAGRGLWGREEFHSDVLAWLLDPRESHGFGDHFLRRFLHCIGVRPASRSSDWSTTEVTREWPNEVDGQRGFLDILIVNEAQQVLCAIENKVFSSEHSEQLTRYRRALKDHYSTFTRHHVYLTPEGAHPSSEKEQVHWTPVAYSTVFKIIQRILETNDTAANDGVRAFLHQYATTLRRNIVPDTSVAQQARRIYLEHREAIELIAANKPDWVAETKQWLKEEVARQEEWILDVEGSRFVRFRSTDWNHEIMRKGTGWSGTKALVLFQFRFDGQGRCWLDLALSKGNDANNHFRQKLLETVRQHPQLFRSSAAPLSDDWVILHWEVDHVLDDADYGVGWDDGTTRDKLRKWIEDFAASKFAAMNEIIVNCLSEYEAEGQTQ